MDLNDTLWKAAAERKRELEADNARLREQVRALREACKTAIEYLEGKRSNATVWTTLLTAIHTTKGAEDG